MGAHLVDSLSNPRLGLPPDTELWGVGFPALLSPWEQGPDQEGRNLPFHRELPFLRDLAAWVLFLVRVQMMELTKWALVKGQ